MSIGFRYFTTTVRRFAAGTYVDGTYTNGAYTDISIQCGIQNPKPDDLELLEEGKRAAKNIVVFSEEQLHIADQNKNADWILIDGEWFEVNNTRSYKTMWPGNYRAIATKIENVKDTN